MDNPKHVGEHQRRAWIRNRLHHGDHDDDDDYYNDDDVLADCSTMSFVLRNPNMNKLSWTINYIISYISLNDMISDTFFLWVFSENLEHAFALMPSRVAIFGRAVILN